MRAQKIWAGSLLALFFFIPVAALAGTNLGIEEAIQLYFADAPVMAAIAACESEFTQFNRDGSVLHGGYKRSMIGIFQVAPLHWPEAKRHGFDLDTVAGNMAYARYLYDHEGTRPWLDSSHCWKKKMGMVAGGSTTSPNTNARMLVLQRQAAQLATMMNALIAARESST